MITHSADMRPPVPNPMNDSQDNYGDAESAPREITSREYAARLLTAPAALMQLSLVEAKIVVSYMRPDRVPAGETFITEGDTDNTGFMCCCSTARSLWRASRSAARTP